MGSVGAYSCDMTEAHNALEFVSNSDKKCKQEKEKV